MQIIIMGYCIIILLGTFLLSLPLATRSGTSVPLVDALFTATSATCVTGLIVRDTYSFWSPFGQAVIISLIQVGGLGFVTFAIMAATLTGRRIGLRERMLMQGSVSAPQLGGIVRMTRFIIAGALGIELTGALLLSIRFIPRFGVGKGIWFSIFHAISAFCNAGFDLMGIESRYSSLTAFAGDPLVSLVIVGLITLGGLGYFVWADIRTNRGNFKRYKLHTKIVLVTSLALTLGGTVLIFLFELGGEVFEGLNFGQQWLASLFQSVTMRTAGFNTVDLGAMSNASALLLMVLMLIGGSSGSTAGGIKTTTFAVFFLCIWSEVRRRRAVEVFGRRISDETVRNACCVVALSLVFCLLAAMLLCCFDGIGLKESLFETVSAVATVGCSLGVTPTLSTPSLLVVILLMFYGRVGSLTILVAFSQAYENAASTMPLEEITIG
ncbi:MAG: Trk family potassium uptake protein [Ruminococcaceae bacterium]|nr:Trk family potassium uptake protein [Oscillospiraceae bacterium]